MGNFSTLEETRDRLAHVVYAVTWHQTVGTCGRSWGRRNRFLIGSLCLYSILNNYPKCSMYGLFTYIWVVLGVNVGKYTIH